jgi:DNA-binding IclR family transcriptional regulator
VGAVSVSGSIAEISSEKLPAVIEAVKDTGRQISLQLGYPS